MCSTLPESRNQSALQADVGLAKSSPACLLYAHGSVCGIPNME
jgi:hypothetical protein